MKNNYIFIIKELNTSDLKSANIETVEEAEKNIYLQVSKFWDEKIRQWLINSNTNSKNYSSDTR